MDKDDVWVEIDFVEVDFEVKCLDCGDCLVVEVICIVLGGWVDRV